MIDLNKIKELHRKGIVTFAGVKRAKIINRFFELRKKSIPKMDCYIKIADEVNANYSYVRKIVNRYNRSGEV